MRRSLLTAVSLLSGSFWLSASPAVFGQAPPAPSAPDAPSASSAPSNASLPEPAPVRAAPQPELAPFPEAAPAPAATARVAHANVLSVQAQPTPVRDAASPAPVAAPIPRLSAWLGVASLWVASEGLDAFSKDDALVMFDAGAALSIARADGLDLAAVASLGIGASDASYRGEATSLDFTRISLGPEARWSLLDRLFLFGRLSPSLTRLSAGLDESSSGARLSQTKWVWGGEGALGLDLRFAEAAAALPAALGFYLRVEGGYAWSASSDLSLRAGSDAPVRTAPLELGELALRGPSFKASVGAGF
jgi:hypothetical protein